MVGAGEQGDVGVRMDVYEAGSDDMAGGVNRLRGLRLLRNRADLRDRVADDADIGGERRAARAVYDFTVTNQQIEGIRIRHSRFLSLDGDAAFGLSALTVSASA